LIEHPSGKNVPFFQPAGAAAFQRLSSLEIFEKSSLFLPPIAGFIVNYDNGIIQKTCFDFKGFLRKY